MNGYRLIQHGEILRKTDVTLELIQPINAGAIGEACEGYTGRAYRACEVTTHDDPVLMVGRHPVVFEKDGSVTVGCTSVDAGTMQAIVEQWGGKNRS